MSDCTEMKRGEVYSCGVCGLELQVMKECCDDSSESDASCQCEPCQISCCGQELTKKEM